MASRLLAQVIRRQYTCPLERRIEVIGLHDVLPCQAEALAKFALSWSSLPKKPASTFVVPLSAGRLSPCLECGARTMRERFLTSPSMGHPMQVSAFLAAMAIVVGASPVAAAPPPPLHLAEAIVVSRAQLNADGTTRSSRLWIKEPAIDPLALVPDADHEENNLASWSPRGTHLAFQRTHITSNPDGQSAIFTIGANGFGLRRATMGRGNFLTPAWGPTNAIAFVTRYPNHDCLSMVDAESHRQRDLFCAPAPAQIARPVWSTDGRSILIHAG